MSRQWYMAIRGHRVGPVSLDEVQQNLRTGTLDANAHVYTAQLGRWTPVRDVLSLSGHAHAAPPPPPPPGEAGRQVHGIDFQIAGEDI
jgi:hypothetical protein